MIEVLIVAALVIWSAVIGLQKVFLKTANSVFMALSNVCVINKVGQRSKMVKTCDGF